MHLHSILLIVVALQFSFVIHSDAAKRSSVTPRLLIISLDGERFSERDWIEMENDWFKSGFRHAYLNEHQLPTINRFRNQGVQATRGMRPTFTTMTYPNHVSIATGEEIQS